MELLNESLMALDIDLPSKLSVIEKIADILEKPGRVIDRQQYIKDVVEREEIISTYVGDLIAIPHARSCAVTYASLVYLRLNKPVDWNSSEKAQYIFGIAVPADNIGNSHLTILSSIARKLLDDKIRATFFNSNSKGAIIAALLS
ncbi:MAG TPA: PTS sorbitol transporter subunit IIA [Anaerolineaceae bacterium]|nr:PTS sorbitol transporter subunit IIA [Anaerolineaceae bacterium]